MTKTIKDLRNQTHSELLNQRSLDRYVNCDRFEEAFKLATDREKKVLSQLVNECDVLKLRKVVKAIFTKHDDLANLDHRTLRTRARDVGVRNYNHLGKLQLVAMIRKQEAI